MTISIGRSDVSITDEAIDELRARIGKEHVLTAPFHTAATTDAIRHFAHGVGDVNPMWTDAAYAGGTRFGGLVASPCFLSSCGMPRSVGLPGVHALYTGSTWEFTRPVPVDTRIVTSVTLSELNEKHGDFAGRQFLEVDEAIYRDEAGLELARLKSHCMRVERRSARSKSKYAELRPHQYTTDDLASIVRDYEAEEIRGAVPRHVEEISVGDELPQIVKGPLTITDLIGFLQGWGGMFVRPHGIGHAWRKRHPAAYTLDEFGIPDVPERVHWDNAASARSGIPVAYDYGPQRIAWLANLVTNWMSDAGWMRSLSVEVRKLNLVADTTWCRGSVTAVDVEQGLVTLDVRAVNQRDEVTAYGEAVVELPRREGAR